MLTCVQNSVTDIQIQIQIETKKNWQWFFHLKEKKPLDFRYTNIRMVEETRLDEENRKKIFIRWKIIVNLDLLCPSFFEANCTCQNFNPFLLLVVLQATSDMNLCNFCVRFCKCRKMINVRKKICCSMEIVCLFFSSRSKFKGLFFFIFFIFIYVVYVLFTYYKLQQKATISSNDHFNMRSNVNHCQVRNFFFFSQKHSRRVVWISIRYTYLRW